MEPPKQLKKGPPWLRNWLNKHLAFSKQNRIRQGPSYRLHETPNGTMLVFSTSRGGGGIFPTFPFQVLPGGGSDANSVKVSFNSFLLEDSVPTSKIDITGLDTPFSLDAGHRIWLEIDLSATYAETPGPITASIQHGAKWGADKSFYPLPVEYDTDDGTRLGSTGTPSGNEKQIKIFIPIAYTTTKETDEFGLVAKGFAYAIGDDVYLIQQCRDHLMMGGACIDGGQVDFANVSPYAPQPEPHDD